MNKNSGKVRQVRPQNHLLHGLSTNRFLTGAHYGWSRNGDNERRQGLHLRPIEDITKNEGLTPGDLVVLAKDTLCLHERCAERVIEKE